MCEICSKLTTKTPEQRRSGINFEHLSHICYVVSVVDSDQASTD